MKRAVLSSAIRVAVVASFLLSPPWGAAQEGSFTNVRPVAGINTRGWESMGSLSGDGRTIYFTSDRDATGELSLYLVDLWVGTWNPETERFEDLTSEGVLQAVNSDFDECTPYISDDNLVLAFYSDRPPSQGYDVWVATRQDDASPFSAPVNAKGPLAFFSEMNSGYNDFGQSMSPDGLRLYFSSDREGPDSAGVSPFGGFDIYTATRSTTTEPFAASSLVNMAAPINTAGHEFSPIVSSDGRTLFWSDLDIAPFRGGGSANIWMATAADAGGGFDDVRPVPGVNTNAVEFDFFVTRDWPAAGARIYFSSDREGVLDPPHLPYRGDVWVATWVPDEPFRRGDASANDQINVADAIVILTYLFLGSALLECPDAGDADDDGALNLTDPLITLNYAFLEGPAPRAPFTQCGPDPTRDDLHCPSYPRCP